MGSDTLGPVVELQVSTGSEITQYGYVPAIHRLNRLQPPQLF